MICTRYFNDSIVTWDDVFDWDTLTKMCAEVVSLNYYPGVSDYPDQEPTGLSTKTDENLKEHFYYNKVWEFMENNISELDGYHLIKEHSNCFGPRELANYHTDVFDYPGWTVLFYANTGWNINQGGETKFIIDTGNFTLNDISVSEHKYPLVFSIAPIPGRIVMFKSMIQHTATPFKDAFRYTPAWTFAKDGQEPTFVYRGKTND